MRFQRMGKGGFHAKNLPCTPKLHQWFPWIPHFAAQFPFHTRPVFAFAKTHYE